MKDFFALIKHVRYFDECTYIHVSLKLNFFINIQMWFAHVQANNITYAFTNFDDPHISSFNYIQFAYRIRVRRISVTSSLLTQLSFNSLIIKLIIYLIN